MARHIYHLDSKSTSCRDLVPLELVMLIFSLNPYVFHDNQGVDSKARFNTKFVGFDAKRHEITAKHSHSLRNSSGSGSLSFTKGQEKQLLCTKHWVPSIEETGNISSNKRCTTKAQRPWHGWLITHPLQWWIWHWLGEMSAGHQHRHWNSQMFPPYHSFVAEESNISSYSSVFFSWRWLVLKNHLAKKLCHVITRPNGSVFVRASKEGTSQHEGTDLGFRIMKLQIQLSKLGKYVFKNRLNETWRWDSRCFSSEESVQRMVLDIEYPVEVTFGNWSLKGIPPLSTPHLELWPTALPPSPKLSPTKRDRTEVARHTLILWAFHHVMIETINLIKDLSGAAVKSSPIPKMGCSWRSVATSTWILTLWTSRCSTWLDIASYIQDLLVPICYATAICWPCSHSRCTCGDYLAAWATQSDLLESQPLKAAKSRGMVTSGPLKTLGLNHLGSKKFQQKGC